MFYPILKCINPEGFSGAVQKYKCEEFETFFITSKDVEAPFFETKPIGEFEPPKDFPNCCNFHRGVLAQGIKRIEEFPNCCDAHRKLKKASWFNKKNYEGIPLKTIYTLAHTEYHIVNRIDREDWYKDITDYIEYCISSFGRLPDGYGSPIGLFIYLDNLEFKIKGDKSLPKAKKAKILSFINTFFSQSDEKAEGGLNILYTTYSRWLKTFPFELSIFQHLKERYKKTLPFLKSEPVLNPYTGASKAPLKTQDELVALLLSITNNILCEINTVTLHRKGLIDDMKKLHLEMAIEKRLLEIKEMKERPVDERRQYIAVLKQWFSEEVSFLGEVRSILSEPITIESKKPTKAEKLREYVVQHGFFELQTVKALSAHNREVLIKKIAENDLPYAIAMFDYLGFFSHLKNAHFHTAYKMQKEVAKWLGIKDKEGRSIKGNMGSLLNNSNESKGRYTAYLHKEAVKNDYQNLK